MDAVKTDPAAAPLTFGTFLKKLRGQRSLRQVAQLAKQRGMRLVTMNTIGQVERDALKRPPTPEFLKELAALYREPYEVIAAHLQDLRYQAAPSTRQRGDTYDSQRLLDAQAEADHLRERYADVQQRLRGISDALLKLLNDHPPNTRLKRPSRHTSTRASRS